MVVTDDDGDGDNADDGDDDNDDDGGDDDNDDDGDDDNDGKGDDDDGDDDNDDNGHHYQISTPVKKRAATCSESANAKLAKLFSNDS